MAPRSDTSAPPTLLGRAVKEARQQYQLSVRELAKKAGVSHTQISRLESGQTRRPSREILVALARALDRNPLPLLILAGHFDLSEAQDVLDPMFREGAELPWAIWGDPDPPERVAAEKLLRDPKASRKKIDELAADVFTVAESDETLWDDSYALAAARGEGAAQVREVMAIWRFIGPDLRDRWLEYGRQLRRVADLEYLAEQEQFAGEINTGATKTKKGN